MSLEHNDSCCKHSVCSSVYQDLDEMDFERGIWSAALNGEIERLQTILNKGTDPSMPDRYGFTALHYAARNGKIDACMLLLKHKANVNAQINFGATPLHRAAYQGHAKICQLLLDHMADPSLTDSDGKTALHKAAEQGHLNVAKILLQQNIHLKCIKDKYSCVPQDYVDPHKHEELYNLLVNVKEDSDYKNMIL